MIHVDVRISWYAIFEGAREMNNALEIEHERQFEVAIKHNYWHGTESGGPR